MRVVATLFTAVIACLLPSTSRAQDTPSTWVPPTYPPGLGPGYGPDYSLPRPSTTLEVPPVETEKSISDWSVGDPVPTGYHRAKRVRVGFIVAGAVLLPVAYAGGFVLGALGNGLQCAPDACPGGSPSASYAPLLVPVVGPFIELFEPGVAGFTRAVSAIDGFAQVGGLAMLIYGIASPTTVLVKGGEASRGGAFELSLAPVVGPGRQGMGVVGTF
jgi:hypothetical protein